MSITKTLENNLDRREFLKKSAVGLLGFYGGLRIADLIDDSLEGKLDFSANNSEAVEQLPVGKEYHKVRPAEDGCYVGFYHSGYWDQYYNVLVGEIGKKPKIMVPSLAYLQQITSFPKEAVDFITPRGAIPFMYKPLNRDIGLYGFENLVKNKEFGNDITKYADGLVKCGKSILLCTMRELNTDWHIWGQKPELAKEVWRLMKRRLRGQFFIIDNLDRGML